MLNQLIFVAIQNVQFDLLIRIEIVWSSNKTNNNRLCLSGLEIRKIGLLPPVQILDEIDGVKYKFGCRNYDCLTEKTKLIPPRLEYEGNGTFYTIITVKLRNMTEASDLRTTERNRVYLLCQIFFSVFGIFLR